MTIIKFNKSQHCYLVVVWLLILQAVFSFQRVSFKGFSLGVPNRFGSKSLLFKAHQYRIGHGYDIHRLVEGKKLVIAGVHVPFHLGADAHSDGDAVYHSVVDAILGALALPDIGQLFPDSDPQWKGADSSIFMKEVYRIMVEKGYRIGNLDVTLILEQPKVKDLKPAMKENLVTLLHTSPDRVNVKARTHEKMDSVGESRAYECHVVVLLEKV